MDYINMILSTTPQIEGCPIREYKGVVTGETIIGANFLKDIGASLRDFFGGRSASYEKVLRQAKDTAMNEMMQFSDNKDNHIDNKGQTVDLSLVAVLLYLSNYA